MATIQIEDVKNGLRLGKFIDLSNDYRTSAIVRACLPQDVLFAMSSVAFQQHVQQGTAAETDARLQSLCDALHDALGKRGDPSQTDFEFKIRGKDGIPRNCPLKVEWSSANKYGVILLPQEHVRFGQSGAQR